jgi:hypothetical protein
VTARVQAVAPHAPHAPDVHTRRVEQLVLLALVTAIPIGYALVAARDVSIAYTAPTWRYLVIGMSAWGYLAVVLMPPAILLSLSAPFVEEGVRVLAALAARQRHDAPAVRPEIGTVLPRLTRTTGAPGGEFSVANLRGLPPLEPSGAPITDTYAIAAWMHVHGWYEHVPTARTHTLPEAAHMSALAPNVQLLAGIVGTSVPVDFPDPDDQCAFLVIAYLLQRTGCLHWPAFVDAATHAGHDPKALFARVYAPFSQAVFAGEFPSTFTLVLPVLRPGRAPAAS